MEFKKDMDSWNLLMVENIEGLGKMECKKDKEFLLVQMVIYKKGNG